MRTLERFEPHHLKLLLERGVHPSQKNQVSPPALARGPQFLLAGSGYSVFDSDNRIIACGGIVSAGSPWGMLWALGCADLKPHLVYLHGVLERFIQATIAAQRLRRVEATVDVGGTDELEAWRLVHGAPEGRPRPCRWLRLLGFSYEGAMLNYGEGGETHLRYARIGLPGGSR